MKNFLLQTILFVKMPVSLRSQPIVVSKAKTLKAKD